jgi:hypothetical protein
MIGQRGSVLVGVLALSLVMTIAASSYIMLSTNSAKDALSAGTDKQLFYAAESGMNIALRWIRGYSHVNLIARTIPNNLTLTKGTNGYQSLNGALVKVILLWGGPGEGLYTIKSIAYSEATHDTLRITQFVSNPIAGPGAPLLSTVFPSDWSQDSHP